MSRALFTLLLLASPLFAAKPNVVLIVIDGLGQTDLGCYGSKYHNTPNLDALAKSGVKLTDATASAPVSAPTRAALLTGKHPARLNLTDEPFGGERNPRHRLRDAIATSELLEDRTLAEELKQAGYATGHIGRWDLGGAGPIERGQFGRRNGHGEVQTPKEYGFETTVGDVPVWNRRWDLSYFAPFGIRDPFQKNWTPGSRAPLRVLAPLAGLELAVPDEYLTDRLTTEAEKFIAANKAKPFFLHLSHYAVHPPLDAKKEVIEKYKPGKFGQQGNPAYAAMVASVDDSVGRVLKALDDAKIADNTVVIFTSSCGGYATLVHPDDKLPPTFNAPYRDGQGFLYEGGLRVPFIIRGPRVGSANLPVTSVDVMPTVLALCGVKSDVKLDGRDLSGVLGGDKGVVKAESYLHFPHYSPQGGRPGGAVRSEQWKYIEYFDSDRRDLFDISKDVSESRNLISDKPDVAKDLAKKLADWRKEVGAKMPRPNPDYKPNPQATDGTVTLVGPLGDAHGVMLRFEPLPHKNTFGFWVNKDDFITWEFTVADPGTFEVTLTQGCGKGSGGAEVELSVGESKTTHTVKDTGGFQAFEKLPAGKLTIEKAGRHTLTVKAKTKPGAAVMDLQQVLLTPVK